MCGIAGIVVAARRPRAADASSSWAAMVGALRHRGPDEFGVYRDTRAGLGHARLSIIDLDHRPAAALERGRHGLDRLQRRDLQLRRAARRTRGARPPVPHEERHRGHRPRLGGVGRAGVRPLQRPVGGRPVGLRGRARSCWRAIPFGVRPLYVCEHARPALLRQRGEGDLRRRRRRFRARSTRSASSRRSPSGPPCRPRASSRASRSSSPATCAPGRTAACRRPRRLGAQLSLKARGTASAARSTMPSDATRAALEEATRLRMLRADVPGRQLPLRRPRQLARRRARPARQGRAGSTPSRCGSRTPSTTRPVPAADGRRTSAATTTRWSSRGATSPRVFPDVVCAHRAADPADRAGAAVPAVEARARQRHQGGADRRRRRRDVRRLRPVPRGEGAALLGAASRSRSAGRCCSSGSTRISRGRRSRSARCRGSSSARTSRHGGRPGSATTCAGARTAALRRLFSRRAARGDRPAATSSRELLGDAARRSSRAGRSLAQDQYIEIRTLLSGYLLSSQGDRMLMANSVEGRFPFLDRDVCRAGRLAARALQAARASTRSTSSSASARRPGARDRSSSGRSSPTARRTRWRSPGRTRRRGSTRSPAIGRWRTPASSNPAAPSSCCRSASSRGDAGQFSNADNMAVVGVLSVQLLFDRLLSRPHEGTRQPAWTTHVERVGP